MPTSRVTICPKYSDSQGQMEHQSGVNTPGACHRKSTWCTLIWLLLSGILLLPTKAHTLGLSTAQKIERGTSGTAINPIMPVNLQAHDQERKECLSMRLHAWKGCRGNWAPNALCPPHCPAQPSIDIEAESIPLEPCLNLILVDCTQVQGACIQT